jgi:DNA invertase Pin-like site-specific DNA recombinase
MTTNGFEFVRVSTGSQDESTQITELDTYSAANGINVVDRIVLHGYSASHGTQEPALRAAIEGIKQGRYSVILVTDSSRLDRREDLDAQAEILLAIRQAGGDVVSITEPQFGKTDFAGRIVTLVAQYGNAEKSRNVKDQTFRGVKAIIANASWYGPLPLFWSAIGERYAKKAVCTDPDAVRAIYEGIRNGHSLSSIAREYNTYPTPIRTLIQTRANYTGLFNCKYTYAGQTNTWQHQAAGDPPVDSELWHAANRVMDERSESMNNLGGRPVSQAVSWLSGLLACPSCGGRLYPLRGKSLRCGGKGKDRRACGNLKPLDLAGVTAQIEEIVTSEYVAIYRYQRVSGNQGEFDDLKAKLDAVRQTLATSEADDLSEFVSERLRLREQISSFELVTDTYDMRETEETLADLWQTGDKREILKAVMRYIKFIVHLNGHVSIDGEYPDGITIELNDDTCIKVANIALQRRRIAQYYEENQKG